MRLILLAGAFCLAAKPKAKLKTLQEVVGETEEGAHPRAFPQGVLNTAWANDKKFLSQLRRGLRSGRPMVVQDFLFPAVADALLEQLQALSQRQDDADDYPFQRLTEGPFAETPSWEPLKPTPCHQVVTDFLEQHKHRFAFLGHILVGRTGDKHNAWYSSFRRAMEHPAVVSFWQQLFGMPKWVTRYDPSWSWLRPGDYYGLHADDAQARMHFGTSGGSEGVTSQLRASGASVAECVEMYGGLQTERASNLQQVQQSVGSCCQDVGR
ncbi:unnamed protein product [Effrenium voratum]|nr:unnamed protein product [Effrenium voratum]